MTRETTTAEAAVLEAFDSYARALCHDEGKPADEPKEAPEPLPDTVEVFRKSFGTPPEWFVGIFRAFYAGYAYGTDSADVPADSDADYCMTCTAKGLEDRHIYEGDTLYIHTQSTAESGQIVVASVDGEAPVVRVAARTNRGLLLYASAEYEPLFVPQDELERVTIYGRVVQVTRDLN